MGTMSDLITGLYHNGAIRAIDCEFAKFIAMQLQNDADPVIAWAALVSFELGKGNVCVDLAQLNQAALFDLPSKEALAWQGHLQLDKVLADGGAALLARSLVVSDGSVATPLVLAYGRLYLYRYWHAEKFVAAQLAARAVNVALPEHAANLLDALFDTPALSANEINWQKVAAANALSYRFAVISGGPGTGKTTTVAKLLAALISCAPQDTSLEIKLVAPTGKAANRLSESIGQAVTALPISDEIKAKMPMQASTIHRLLGALPNRIEFRHHQDNPLHLDILVVDEASMVDLPLMARLLGALPPRARVILLGDRDQLASVEAGAVLGDICSQAANQFSPARTAQLTALTRCDLSTQVNAQITAVTDGVCLLTKSYRFDGNSGIGTLAKIINQGLAQKINAVFNQGFGDIAWHDLTPDNYQQALQLAISGYRQYLQLLSGCVNLEIAKAALAQFATTRILCGITEGAYGVKGLNANIEHMLSEQKLITRIEHQPFYLGRPVMVTQNDHGLGLYNGDIGIVMTLEQGVRVVFEMADGSLKALLPSRLPEHQTAYAMTIHKSQGSEFGHTLLIFPPQFNPVMTRELLYTGVTRAKSQLDIFATLACLERAVNRKTFRFSGLAQVLQMHSTLTKQL